MTHPSVDPYLAKATQWREELTKLREIVAAVGLTEEFKWGHPCYTLDGNNVVLIHGFKEYCALLFMKGALMDDPEELIRRFEEDPDYHVAFEALTPGRQRGYLLHFAGAKQSATREARIEKCREKIFAGKGFMD
jgi:uncharacterized protein YdeI (YjbR/CyaY-like superfamily)